jgi:DNA-directed RNA polymerase specialized sigma24 family protein
LSPAKRRRTRCGQRSHVPSSRTAVNASASELERNIAQVFNLCARMTLSKNDAELATYQTFRRAVLGDIPADQRTRELWLLKIAAHVIEHMLSAEPEVDFDLLDDTLRSEATRTNEVASLTSPQREFLLWELKQGCMTSVINCLSPGERVAFVLSSVLGKSDEEAAAALGIKESALKVRLSRARKKIGDYLAPRCEHVEPRNPCHCPSRIGVALRKGFIAPPLNPEVTLRKNLRSFDQEIKSHDVVNIFRTLPEVEVPEALLERLRAALQTGHWDGDKSDAGA